MQGLIRLYEGHRPLRELKERTSGLKVIASSVFSTISGGNGRLECWEFVGNQRVEVYEDLDPVETLDTIVTVLDALGYEVSDADGEIIKPGVAAPHVWWRENKWIGRLAGYDTMYAPFGAPEGTCWSIGCRSFTDEQMLEVMKRCIVALGYEW